MKWRNSYGRSADRHEKKESLLNIKQKKFAWLPVVLEHGDTIWLTYYTLIYYSQGYNREVYERITEFKNE